MLGLDDEGSAPDSEAPRAEPPRAEPPPKPSIPLLRQPSTPAPPPASGGEFTIERLERPAVKEQGPDVLERSIFAAMERAMSDVESESDEESDAIADRAAEAAEESDSKESPVAEATTNDALDSSRPKDVERLEAGGERPEATSDAAPVEATSKEAAKADGDGDAEPNPDATSEPATAAAASPSVEVHERERADAKTPTEPDRPDVVSDIVRLASDLDLLGVPESDRRSVRAALLEAGRTLDGDAPAWSAIEDAIAQGIRHPALARKLLPLLMPFLDKAA